MNAIITSTDRHRTISASEFALRPKFPEVIDSSNLALFRACPQKFFRGAIQHWKPQSESVHLVAGGAFASGIEAARLAYYIHDLPKDEAEALGLQALVEHYGDFEPPANSPKSLERMMGALEFYYESYPFGIDTAIPINLPGGGHGIEFAFARPLPVLHPETGHPILFAGRADMIASFAGGTYIFDEKTTSSLGTSFATKWEMRGQFTGYCWAAREEGLHVDGVIVRGISILKTKYDTMQPITNRAAHEIDRWFVQTCRDLERMKTMYAEGYWDYNLDESCAGFGNCQFLQACKSPDPEPWLTGYFEQRIWDPVSRTETLVLPDTF